METSTLFKRYVGSAPGYEKRPETKQPIIRQVIETEAPKRAKIPVIEKGKVIRWTYL